MWHDDRCLWETFEALQQAKTAVSHQKLLIVADCTNEVLWEQICTRQIDGEAAS